MSVENYIKENVSLIGDRVYIASDISEKLNIVDFSKVFFTITLSPNNTIPSFALPNKVESTIAKTYCGFTPSAIDRIALFNFFSGISGAIYTLSPIHDTFSYI